MLADWPEADSVVSAMGSGGTAAGLVMGRREAGGRGPRVVAVPVCNDEAFFRRRVAGILGDPAEADLEIAEGFKGRGYALSTPEELAFIADVARIEGLLVDPVYTGKALLGLVRTVERRPGALGERVLFLHTGGIFGLFDQAEGFAGLG